MNEFDRAIESLRDGEIVLIFDSKNREGEIDLVVPAQDIGFEDIAFLRKHGGGLICVTVPHYVAKELGLPFMSDVLEKAGFGESKIPYGEKSSFSLWVNHKKTFTGITDKDRALTARKLARTHQKVINGEEIEFNEEFRLPGHVPILRGVEGLLKNRRGHTELSMAMAEMSDTLPCMVICEMLNGKTGDSLSLKKAKAFAERKDLPLVLGEEIIERF